MSFASSSFSVHDCNDHFLGRNAAIRSVAELAKLGSPLLLVHGSDGKRAGWLYEALVEMGHEVANFSVPKRA